MKEGFSRPNFFLQEDIIVETRVWNKTERISWDYFLEGYSKLAEDIFRGAFKPEISLVTCTLARLFIPQEHFFQSAIIADTSFL